MVGASKQTLIFIVAVLLAGNASFVLAANFKSFVIEKVGSDKILINDGSQQYILEHNYECYDSDFLEGAIVYIDTFIYPSYGNTILITGLFGNKTCEVTSADQVNIKKYFVDKVIDSKDEIIVTDSKGIQYLVEYGLGCGLSMWRYEGKVVDINIGGSFLDGIGDRMYLFDSGRDCKIWDADEIGNNSYSPPYSPPYSPQTYTPPPSSYQTPKPISCPVNSHLDNGQCFCDEGFVNGASNDGCIKGESYCQIKFGYNSVFNFNAKTCSCASGYELKNNYCSEIIKTTAPVPEMPSNNTVTKKNISSVVSKAKTMPEKKDIKIIEPITSSFSSSSNISNVTSSIQQPNQKPVWWRKLFNFFGFSL